MTITPIRSNLVRPEGGSLNATHTTRHEFVKSYDGKIPRGFEKLRREFHYLTELPPSVAAHFSRVTAFHDDQQKHSTELRLERIRHPALAKAILRGIITPGRVKELLSAILSFLINDLYPIDSGESSGTNLYRKFHGTRLTHAFVLLTEIPEIVELVTAPQLNVNGLTCPSMRETILWLHKESADLFHDSRLVHAHGDTHLDNMMVTTQGPLDFLLVDPRGESLLPAHYDFAKLMKALRAGYHPIHYGFYEIRTNPTSSNPRIDLYVDHSWNEHYRAGLSVLLSYLPAFADAENVAESQFSRAVQIAELAHVLSFSAYHAHRPEGCDINRVTAYLAIAALLARNLQQKPYSDFDKPLPIWTTEV